MVRAENPTAKDVVFLMKFRLESLSKSMVCLFVTRRTCHAPLCPRQDIYVIGDHDLSERDGGDPRKLVLVGGFLGAGKTTLIGRMVRLLAKKDITSGVITNDQAAGLVDTKLMEASGAKSVSEVAGGCFCCRLEQLVETLQAQQESAAEGGTPAPGVVIAEPVGSCTDLVSTVLLPLEKVYHVPFSICPLSVVVDARRALASLGGRRTPGSFSKDVGYIYRKQLEEAEIVVVNKADVMPAEDLADLLRRLETEYPGKEVFVLSAKTGEGVEPWLERVLNDKTSPERLMEMDYARYGAGEALLGWMNAEVEVGNATHPPQDGDTWLLELARGVATALGEVGAEVAHFKMSLKDEEGRLGTVNQVMGGVPPEISRPFGGSFCLGQLTVNLRAEGDPDRLRSLVEAKLEQLAQQVATPYSMNDVAAFRPGQPVPTARVTSL
jgi:G3E family GTPase